MRYVPSRRAGSTGRLELVADLPEDFALNQPLSPFALAALDLLDPGSPTYPLDVISIIEATLDDPMPLLLAQRKELRDAAYQRLRAEGVPYDERKDALDEITWPRPLAELLEPAFATYRTSNPWIAGLELAPKSVVRAMIENADTFSSLVSRLDLAHCEGVILRYLTDAYRALRQVLPPSVKTDEVTAIVTWLGDLVRAVDSSLLDEWAALAEGKRAQTSDDVAVAERAFGQDSDQETPALTTYQLSAQVRTELFRRVELLATDRIDALADLGDPGWDAAAWDEAADDLYADIDDIAIDQAARSPALVTIIASPEAADWDEAGVDVTDPSVGDLVTGDVWLARQQILDSEGEAVWQLSALVDVAASQRASHAIVHTLALAPVGMF
ncbi:DUF3516 domain-containing protein [Nanchangia anserum]|uniref:DUF3516 domain-containing protein n=1 Tax=Nanchangia anserum TaxID=2692125 RepID=UPI003B8450E7